MPDDGKLTVTAAHQAIRDPTVECPTRNSDQCPTISDGIRDNPTVESDNSDKQLTELTTSLCSLSRRQGPAGLLVERFPRVPSPRH
jgi:hypothetical protein